MATIFDVKPHLLIKKVAGGLKEEEIIKMPEWARFVKTGVSRERQPDQEDWWYIRAAAILRTLYKKGPLGVSKLRKKYGGKKNRGSEPEKFYSASGKIIRTILQQLEEAGLVELEEKEGRKITPEGKSLLDRTASEILKEKGIKIGR